MRRDHRQKENNMHTFIEITDFHAPELDIYARLTETQLRSHHGIENSLFIAESPHVIERALDAGCEPESLLMLPKMLDGRERGQEILARCGDVPVYVAEEDCLKQLTGFPLTRGVLCAMKRPPLPTAETLLRDTKRVVVLEDVMNPTNLGAIFRSAAAMGMDAVLLTPASTDPLYRRCIRVSMGTVFQIPWAWIGEELTDWPEKGTRDGGRRPGRPDHCRLRLYRADPDGPRCGFAERGGRRCGGFLAAGEKPVIGSRYCAGRHPRFCIRRCKTLSRTN